MKDLPEQYESPEEIIEDYDPKECAQICTKRMYLQALKVEEMVLYDRYDKKEAMNLLSSVKHDIVLLNDKENHIERDLFK